VDTVSTFIISGLIVSTQGEMPLHSACHKGLMKLVGVLLEKGANPNAQTALALSGSASAGGSEGEDSTLSRQTPLHLAIVANHRSVVTVLLNFKCTS